MPSTDLTSGFLWFPFKGKQWSTDVYSMYLGIPPKP